MKEVKEAEMETSLDDERAQRDIIKVQHILKDQTCDGQVLESGMWCGGKQEHKDEVTGLQCYAKEFGFFRTHSEHSNVWQVLLEDNAGHSLECGLEKSGISNGMKGNQNERLFGKERDRYVLWTKLWAPPPHTQIPCWSPNPQCDGVWRWGLWELIRFRWSPWSDLDITSLLRWPKDDGIGSSGSYWTIKITRSFSHKLLSR